MINLSPLIWTGTNMYIDNARGCDGCRISWNGHWIDVTHDRDGVLRIRSHYPSQLVIEPGSETCIAIDMREKGVV